MRSLRGPQAASLLAIIRQRDVADEKFNPIVTKGFSVF
jgi:hypothetical protein